jgi:flagellar protein FliO/FliZ
MLLTLLVIVILIVYLSHLFSKFVAMGTLKAAQSKHMKVIDRIIIGQDRMILIVQVQSRFFLIGTTSEEMTLLAELSTEDVTSILQEKDTTKDTRFKEVFFDQLKSKWKK